MNWMTTLTCSWVQWMKFKVVLFANIERRSSCCCLNWKFDAFLMVFKRSNDISSITQECSVFTLLIATYVMSAVRSRGPILIHAFSKVSFWLLCIVIAQESFKGNCCLSWKVSSEWDVTVTGHTGTHFDKIQ